MDQLRNFADNRLVHGCIYCGEAGETRDHVPSRILLDHPLPENLPVVSACTRCNQGFSLDEEYLACLIESARVGSVAPTKIRREQIASILQNKPALRRQLQRSKSRCSDQVVFKADTRRVKNVLLKLARGHAAFDLSHVCRDDPAEMWCRPLNAMTANEVEDFEAIDFVGLLGEVGSRQSQQLAVLQFMLTAPDGKIQVVSAIINDWVEVQENRYRYLASDDTDGVRIRIVIAEYLACSVFWTF